MNYVGDHQSLNAKQSPEDMPSNNRSVSLCIILETNTSEKLMQEFSRQSTA